MSKLRKIQKRAVYLGIEGKISESPIQSKKFMIILPTGKKIHFGQVGYEDFLDHKSDARRYNFHKRFENNVCYNDKNSGLYYSQKLLW